MIFCLAAPAAADPASTREAGEHFRRAEAADKAKNYAEAIDEYNAAYALSPHPDVLYNIAIDHERLEQWGEAADAYQRYLDERDGTPASDAAAVTAKIRELRAKAKQQPTTRPRPEPHDVVPPQSHVVQPPPYGGPPQLPGAGDGVPPGPPGPPGPGPSDQPPTGITADARAFTRWHVAASYGVAFGSEPSERYQLRVGARFGGRADIDLVGGTFGLNDYALGGMVRIAVARDVSVQPVLIAAATVGYAKQDASAHAGTRVPIGAEAGAGIQLSSHYRLELDAVVRLLVNGWGANDTSAFTYVNDQVAFGIDLGGVLDIPVISGGR
jgi:hypothetical protein